MTDARTLVAVLGGSLARGRGVCRCPAHDDRRPSLGVSDAPDGKLLVHCFAGCTQAEVIDALRDRGLWPGAEEREREPWPRRPTPARTVRPKTPNSAAPTAAARLWRDARPLAGTPAETYLREHRGLPPPYPSALRFLYPAWCAEAGGFLPALLAAVETPAGVFVAVQRTFLDGGTGRKASLIKPKMALGPVGNGAVRLAPAGATLGLAEGVEDALSVTRATGLPCWACLGDDLGKLDLPAGVAEVVLCADADPAGREAARRAAERYAFAGRRVRIALPPAGHKDFNEALLAGAAPMAGGAS